jgi:glycosyltransferase involved in cell wall biosynthesis
MKLLHIVPHLRPGALRRDLLLLLTGAADAAVTVCTLGDDDAALGPTGVPVKALAWTRTLDPRPLWRLARLVREFQPDVIHTWGLSALRAFRLAARKWPGRVVVNKPLPPARALNTLDRWLLRSADRLLVRGAAEAARCRQAGIPEAKLRLVPPGVAPQPFVPTDSLTIVCAGALRPPTGFWDAIWTLDILRFVHDDIELVIAGEGPERARLECFAENTGLRRRIHFVGEQGDLAALLKSAAMVWIPSRADTGASVALEAMAAGRPVIASRWPALAEVVVDGETGWLIEPGNKMELAQKSRRLLDDPCLRRAMGEAGRRHAGASFSAAQFVPAWWQACIG